MQPISNVYTNCELTYEKVDEFTGQLKIGSAVLTDENIPIMAELTSVAKSQILNENNAALMKMLTFVMIHMRENLKKKGGLFDDDHRDKSASNDESIILELESNSDNIRNDNAPAINIIRLQSCVSISWAFYQRLICPYLRIFHFQF